MSDDEDPRVTELFRSSRRWERAYRVFLVCSALLVLAGSFAFNMYREYVIWSR